MTGEEREIKVIPIRVRPVYQFIFTFANPSLDLFLSRNRVTGRIELLIINKPVEPVPIGK